MKLKSKHETVLRVVRTLANDDGVKTEASIATIADVAGLPDGETVRALRDMLGAGILAIPTPPDDIHTVLEIWIVDRDG